LNVILDRNPDRTNMPPSYPQIVVTGDSISQQAFKIGGYGAALVDAVSIRPFATLYLC
jgi:hypothetical protein